MNRDRDPEAEARRVEEVFARSTEPAEQRVAGGWLVRLAQGDVKRARSVYAPASEGADALASEGADALASRIARCEELYAAAGLPPLFRITPMSQPAGLDQALAARGYGVLEPSLVQVCDLGSVIAVPAPAGLRFESLGVARWMEESGRLRGLSRERVEAETRRLQRCAGAHGVMACAGDRPVGCGLLIRDGAFAGVSDVFVAEAHRRRGVGLATSAHLLSIGRRLGARRGWLSVLADNTDARSVYARLGFATLYDYWYRIRPQDR